MLGTIRPPSALPKGPFLAFTTVTIKGLLSSEAPEKEEKDEVDGCGCQMLFSVEEVLQEREQLILEICQMKT